ncbi:MAG: FtsX-like permease family protein [Bacteroidota bacterium]
MIRQIFKMIWNRKRQNSLIIIEMFFAFLILFVVLSFVFYQFENYRSPLGFDTEDIWIASLNLPAEIDSASIVDTKQRLTQAINSMPEIQTTGYCFDVLPFSNSNWINTSDDNGFMLRTHMIYADEGFADAIGLELIEGEWFNEVNTKGKYSPLVITKLLRDTYYKDSSVIGKVITLSGEQQIVGVVDHYKYHGEFEEERPLSFFHMKPEDDNGLGLVMRVKPGTPPAFEEEVNRTIRNIAKGWDFVIFHQETQRARNSEQTWIPIVALLSACGFLVFNVALGLLGVLMYNIKKRRAEIGLRRAVGAPAGNIITQFLLEMLILTSLGVFVGLIFAAQVPIMKLFEVGNHIFVYGMLASMGIIFVLVSICTLYPSTQASQIHPALALHEE